VAPKLADFPTESEQIIAQSEGPGNSRLKGLARIVHGTARVPQVASAGVFANRHCRQFGEKTLVWCLKSTV
jgi:hypothetical protein